MSGAEDNGLPADLGPKVSVCVRAHNHEKFIDQAIESVLAQETNFVFEILVADDASTDSTGAKLRALSARKPDKFRILKTAKNQGRHRTLRHLYAEARGEYIAMLDGDDFWIGKHKLQRQSDLLDTNPKISACGCRWRDLMQIGKTQEQHDGPRRRGTGNVKQFLSGYWLKHSGLMIRRSMVPSIPEWIEESPSDDMPLQLLCVQKGPLACIDEVMVGYRIHPDAVFSTRNRLRKQRWNIETWKIFRRQVEPKYRPTVYRVLALMHIRYLWYKAVSFANESTQRKQLKQKASPERS